MKSSSLLSVSRFQCIDSLMVGGSLAHRGRLTYDGGAFPLGKCVKNLSISWSKPQMLGVPKVLHRSVAVVLTL